MTAEFSELLKKYPPGRRENLIPILQEVQDSRGYIPEQAVVEIAAHIGIPSVKIYSVATFYNEFRFDPGGKYHLQVCMGTGCQVDGSGRIRHEISRLLNIAPGETSVDGWFSLEWVPCLGVCHAAPVVSVNGEMKARMTPAGVRDLIEQLRNGKK